jgi:hypothetical protein
MRPSLLFRCALVGLAALPMVAGCQSFRDAAGLTKQSPDEFAVVTKAPLVVPPDFNLHPPSPGAAPLNQQDPTNAAQSALFNSSDPQTVAASMRGNFTPGEKMLLASAGAQNADPAVRGNLQSDRGNLQGADPAFTNTVLNGATTANAKATKPVKKSSGWFDWF